MQIQGEIVKITFHNESNGYTIATLKHGQEHTTIVGKLFSATCGQEVKLQGEFITNKTYGEQFAFASYETVMPTSLLGIQKFLGSGLIKGVGLITASHITNHFREQTLEIIETHPERLAEIKGISLKKALSIGQSYMEYRHVQKVIVFLAEYGISVKLALKIYDIFRNNTIKKIQENPYCLIEAVNGIGFLTADKIAAKFGIEKTSKFRLRAGLLHTLITACERGGHTFLPKEDLIKNAKQILDIEETDEFENILKTLALEKVIVLYKTNNLEGVALEKFYRFEQKLAQKLALLSRASLDKKTNISESIKHFEMRNNITFHPQQINAIETAISSGVSVITGGPGTGKTTIIKCILDILDQENHTTLCLAPTGRAAKRMSDSTNRPASTIHRALAMDFETNQFYYNDTNPLSCTAVIIDEFSMVDSALGYYLFRALKADCKVIIVGDKDQLPSVGAGNCLADILASEVINCAHLTQIFRQEEGSLIITNAHMINAGKMPILDNQSKDFFFETKTTPESILETILNLTFSRLPKFLSIPAKNLQVLAPMKSGVCGIINLNEQLQKTLNPPSKYKNELVYGSTTFRQGDKVMQTSNNYSMEFVQYFKNHAKEGKGVFNGDMGFITAVNAYSGELTVTFEGNKVCTYLRNDLSQLSLAYAITIHKSQGSEFDAVVIPATSGPNIIFNRNLIYTAITRAKKLVVIVGEKRHLWQMIRNKQILKRHTLLCDFLKKSSQKALMLFGDWQLLIFVLYGS